MGVVSITHCPQSNKMYIHIIHRQPLKWSDTMSRRLVEVVYTKTFGMTTESIIKCPRMDVKDLEKFLLSEHTKFKKTTKKTLDSLRQDGMCQICFGTIQGYGNNAAPYVEGNCCDSCNYEYVLPCRMSRMR